MALIGPLENYFVDSALFQEFIHDVPSKTTLHKLPWYCAKRKTIPIMRGKSPIFYISWVFAALDM